MSLPWPSFHKLMVTSIAVLVLTSSVLVENGCPDQGACQVLPQSLLQQRAKSLKVPRLNDGMSSLIDQAEIDQGHKNGKLKAEHRLLPQPLSSILQTESDIHSSAKFVTSNDLTDLTSSLVVNGLFLVIHILVFCIIRPQVPKVYSNAWLTGRSLLSPGDGLFSWVRASIKLTPEEVIETSGLDAAMVLKFHDLCISMLSTLGFPLVIIMCPLHMTYGGAVEIDPLSRIDMQNVTDGSWLYWVHAAIVWIVTVVVQKMILRAQSEFLVLRYKWLREMTPPRATTCLVQNIPKEYRTDAKLKSYVNTMLMREAAESAYVVRKVPESFTTKIASRQQNRDKLKEALAMWDQDGKNQSKRPKHITKEQIEVDSIGHYSKQVGDETEIIELERDAITTAAHAGDMSVCSREGFVTFKTRHDTELALSMKVRTSVDEIVFSIPPDPMDVRYDILQQGGHIKRRKTVVGSFLVVILFFCYLPIVIAITMVTSLETLRHIIPMFEYIVMKHPTMTSVWDGLVGSLVLMLVVSFVPTFMMLIIRSFFGLAAETWCQHRLQHWYFYFQILFVLLIFCIGNSLFSTYLKLVKNPTRFFSLLASNLPQAAHFYLNFFPLQWATHASGICRYVNLAKFYYYRRTYDEDTAHDLAEPEDQDYYGIGARSARFTLLFVIALVFCTVCPVICLLALVDFFVCRVSFGYLLVFAETRKADSGGQFWCTQLKHMQLGLFLYISLMVGILTEKAGAYGPGFIAAAAYVYMIDSCLRLEHQFRWARLPLEELVALQTDNTKVDASGCYMQPELIPETSA